MIFVIITVYATNLRIRVEVFSGNSETENRVCMSIHYYHTRQFADLAFYSILTENLKINFILIPCKQVPLKNN